MAFGEVCFIPRGAGGEHLSFGLVQKNSGQVRSVLRGWSKGCLVSPHMPTNGDQAGRLSFEFVRTKFMH